MRKKPDSATWEVIYNKACQDQLGVSMVLSEDGKTIIVRRSGNFYPIVQFPVWVVLEIAGINRSMSGLLIWARQAAKDAENAAKAHNGLAQTLERLGVKG